MPSLAALSIYAFGITSFLAGVRTLISPTWLLQSSGLPTDCLPPTYGNGLAAVAMGLYYSLAAFQENRAFFWATVPMRWVTASVFWNLGGMWRSAGFWEGGGALLTAACLLVQEKKGKKGK